VADKTTETKADDQGHNQDPNFVYGDAPAKKQIDAWEGEGDADLVSDSGEMALANLHFGTTPEADLLQTNSADTETAASGTSDKSGAGVSIAVEENLEGAVIGSLTVTAAEPGSDPTYTVSDERFEVVDGQLVLVEGASLDFETEPVLEVTVTATDVDGNLTEETFNIDVIDVNDAPTDLSLDGSSVAENDAGAVIGTLSSFDPDAGDSVTYTVSDDRFEVVDGELRLADGVSLDHEEAASIEVTVTATDSGGLSTEETFTIDVQDVNEGPSDLSLDGASVAENDAGAVIGTLSSFDPDAGDSVTYTVSDDRFEVVDGELRLADGVSLDHEEAISIELTVTATDSGGLSTEETFTIDVQDVNEGPSDLALDGSSVAENDAGAVVGTLSSFDPDAGDSVTYTVSDDRFEVVDGQLRLVDGVSLDHEEMASIELTVTATDSGGLSTEETFTIDVQDVNEGPSDLSLDGSSVAENDAGAVIGTLSSFDPDAGDSVTYTVSDDRFEVVDGQLRLADGVSLDHEEAASIEVTVTATDSGGLSTEETFTIDVQDVNEGPSDLSLDGASVAENDAGAVIGTLSSFDPDAGDSVTYTVSDDRFEVVDGELRLVDGVSLDHEEAASIELTVTATDSGGLSTEETFTIDVQDVNEGPSDLSLDNATVSENDPGAVVGTLSSFDPDAGDSVTYTVSDDRFEVVNGELRLADGVGLDHEEAASIELTVTATDSGGLSTEETFTIDVQDVNEGPTNLTLDGSSVTENDAGVGVGTLSSFDPDAGDSVTYTVSDDRFEVVDGELRLVDGVSLDHEEAASIELTVTATDSGGLSTEETFTIDVQDINEGPSDLSLDNATVSENDPGAVVGTLSSFDPDAGDSVTYTVSDDRFEVVDGTLRLADGVSLDHEEIDSIDLTVTATDGDGASVTEAFTITVEDVNEAPFNLTLTRETGIAESDFAAGDGHVGQSIERLGLETDAIVFTLSFTTAADVSTTQTLFETGGSVYGTNVVIEDGMLLIYAGEGNDLELSVPINGDTEYNFALELDTASNTIRVLLSDELPLDQMNADNSLVASLTDWADRDYTGSNNMGVGRVGGGSSQGNIGGDFLGDIAAPGLQVFSDSSIDDVLIAAGVDENTENEVVGTLSVGDPDAGDTITYTVSDDRFEVVDGELRLADGVTLDYEAASTIDVTVTATDSGGLSTSETFRVDVVDLNEAPVDLDIDNNTIDENTTDGVVGTISVTDPDAGDTHTFRLVDGDGGPFSIDPNTGEVSLVTPGIPEDSVLRIDASESDSITEDEGVRAIGDLSDEGNTIQQANSDERPELTNDGPFGGPGLQFDGVNDHLDISDDRTLNLTSQSERSFALTIRTGDDVDSRQVIYEEGGTINGFNFYIDGGQLYMGAWSDSQGWSFEAISIAVEPGESYSIVTVFDGASNTYTAYVNGENVGSVEVGDTMNAHSGNIGLGGIAQHTVFHDGANSANTGFYFEGSIGEFAVFNDVLTHAEVAGIDMDFRGIAPDLDFEARDTYDLTVEVTDAAGESYEEVITINLNDVNEAPGEIALDNATVTENTSGAVIGTLSATDPDFGDAVNYTVSDDRFEIVDGQLKLVDGAQLDHEAAETIDISITATDTGGLTSSQDFTISVADINEAPISLELSSRSVAENDAGAVVGTLSAIDPDAGDSVSYTVSDDRFEVVDGDLRLVDGVSFDHEDISSVDVTVTATDSGGLSTSETFTIEVRDENEAPSIVEITPVSENLIMGGSFEEHDVRTGGWRGFREDATGTWDSANGIEVWDNLGGIAAAEGEQFLELDYTHAADAISQTINTEAGQTYIVSFDMRARGATTTDTIEVYWNGELVGVYDPASTDWEEVSFEVTGTGAGDVLEFREAAGESDSLGAHLDNISLVAVPFTVVENDAGAVVAAVSVFDPDAGDSISYTVSDDRFEIVDGNLRLKDGASLDYEAESFVDVTITATDSGGLETSETISIDVLDVAENLQLADGGTTYAESGTAETSVTGGSGDDTMLGGSGDDAFAGGDGNDLFIYNASGGSDSFDGGVGWTDTIDLSNALADDAVYGQDWTITLTEGEIVNEDEDSIELTDDASGFITLDNGETIDFSNIEQIGF